MSFTLSNQLSPQDLSFFYQHTYQNSVDAGLESPQKTLAAFSEELSAYQRDKKANTLIIAKSDKGAYAGYIWAANRGTPDDLRLLPDLAWVYDLFVLPNFRRLGLGRLLLSETEDWSRQQGYTHLGLHVYGNNHAAIPLYKSSGFSTVSCYMEKSLLAEHPTANPPNLSLRPASTQQDIQAYKQLSLERFIHQTRQIAHVSIEQITSNHAQYLETYHFDAEKHHLLLLEDHNGTVIGGAWFYKSKGDIGKTPYLWVQEALSPTTELTMQLFTYLEDWSITNGLKRIRSLHLGGESNLHKAMQTAGFTFANIFMHKTL